MIRYLIALVLCGATAVPGVGQPDGRGRAPLHVEDYATMPEIGGVRFSPDGNRIAYVVTRANFERSMYEGEIHVINTDGTSDMLLTRDSGSSTHPRWSPDGKRIAFLSDRGGRTAIYLIDLAGGESSVLTDEPTPIRDFDWSPDNRTIAFTRQDEAGPRDEVIVVGQNKRYVRLYTIDVETRAVRRLTEGPGTVFSFSIAPDGKSIVFDRSLGNGLDDLYRTDLYLVPITGGEAKALVRRAGIDRTPLFSPDGKSVAFISAGGVHDWLRQIALHVVSVADRTTHLVSAAYGRAPSGFSWSSDSRSLWLEGPWNTTDQIFHLDADGHGFANVSKLDGVIGSTSFDAKKQMAAFVYESLTEPPELYVSSLTTFAPRRLTNIHADYRNRALGETRLIRWKNPKDGLEIEGLLTLPIGYVTGKRYPLLTFAHGGPGSRFDQGFLGYLSYIYPVHVFAAEGFAVLRPNPRGTGGYGQAFYSANRNDWGGMDWLDINAGIDKLIADGIADPARLGFMGWSYGGFMSAWAEGHSDRLKAISIGAPVVDLLSFHGTTDIRDFIPFYFGPAPPAEPQQLEELRHAPLSLDLLRAHSPLWHLKPTHAAVLIQHDDGDERVPLSQGTMLYRMLDELGVNVTMVVYPHEPMHTPRKPQNRIDVGRRNVEFMKKYVMP
ncbi:MAG TPA: S9 family peptidase [Thermoanaerobaculia bacterium]|nr:S9 family peptidase [Thermoanaerobaculia bacterium]